VESKHLAQEQAANHGDAQGTTQLRANSGAEREGQAGQQRRHRGHHDGTETQQARFINSVFRLLVLLTLRLQREVDHHNSVLFDDTDQQDDSDQGDDAEFLAANQQGQNCTHSGGGQSRQNGDGVYEAFVENAEHDINRDQGRENQQRFVRQGSLKRCGGALKRALYTERHANFRLGLVDGFGGLTQRSIGRQVERDGDHGKLSLV